MNSKEREMKEVLTDLLHGPPTVMVVVTTTETGSNRCYVFSTPETFEEFIEYLEECGDYLGVVSYTYYQSLVDVIYDHEYEFWGTKH